MAKAPKTATKAAPKAKVLDEESKQLALDTMSELFGGIGALTLDSVPGIITREEVDANLNLGDSSGNLLLPAEDLKPLLLDIREEVTSGFADVTNAVKKIKEDVELSGFAHDKQFNSVEARLAGVEAKLLEIQELLEGIASDGEEDDEEEEEEAAEEEEAEEVVPDAPEPPAKRRGRKTKEEKAAEEAAAVQQETAPALKAKVLTEAEREKCLSMLKDTVAPAVQTGVVGLAKATMPVADFLTRSKEVLEKHGVKISVEQIFAIMLLNGRVDESGKFVFNP